MRLLLALCALLLTVSASAQTPPPEASGEPDLIQVVETPPMLIGGLEGLASRVVYPDEARRKGIEGKVFVQFIVGRDGRVSDAEAVRCPAPVLCEAAIRAVEASRFEPGTQRGEPVRVRFTVPVEFKLSGPENAEEAAPIREDSLEEREARDLANGIYWTVEEPPVLVGGLEALQRRVRYPEKARVAGSEGRVFVQFVLSETGRVIDAACVRSPDPLLCEAARTAVEASQFTPARQDGVAVKVRYTLPVVFVLR